MLAEKLIVESCERQEIRPGKLTVHDNRGAAMTSKPVALLLAGLGVTKSHSRPHVSNDYPFSESQSQTLKYRPEFPDRFGSLEHGRSSCGDCAETRRPGAGRNARRLPIAKRGSTKPHRRGP